MSDLSASEFDCIPRNEFYLAFFRNTLNLDDFGFLNLEGLGRIYRAD